MRRTITVELAEDTYEELQALSDSLGFSPELTAVYAIRLVNACVREGLLQDVSPWPAHAGADVLAGTGTGGKVIAFPCKRKAKDEG